MVASYAIVPAAGESRRMGKPKLLLPWKQGRIIDAVLESWLASQVDQVIVTVRADNRSLQKQCLVHDVEVVVPEHPPIDMKRSVLYGVDYLRRRYQPTDADCLLLAPADMPELSASLIDVLLAAQDPEDPRLLAPEVDGRRGHPLLIPWQLAGEIGRLEEDQGINALCAQLPMALIQTDEAGALVDIDTPEEYQQQRENSDGDHRC